MSARWRRATGVALAAACVWACSGPGESDAGDGGGGSTAAASIGTLPPVEELEQPGPFTVATIDSTGPRNVYRLLYPRELGEGGIEHPVVAFGPGAGASPGMYATLLERIASHGFVVLSYGSTPAGPELIEAVDWLIAQNEPSSGLLSGKLDTDHVAVAGHSAGSLATFAIADDDRITTTLHLQGGTFPPHPGVANLRAPAQFICGETPADGQDGVRAGDWANPHCEVDFQNAEVPVFYGSLKGAAQIQLTDAARGADDPLKLKMIGAIVGWLRWRLAGDQSQRPRYAGPDCELCDPGSGWSVKQRDLM